MTPDPKKVSQWLTASTSSHAIHDDRLLDELAPLGITYDRKTRKLIAGERSVEIPVRHRDQIAAMVQARGLGGQVNKGDWYGVNGWELAEALVELLEVPSGHRMLNGRGSRFHTCVEALSRAPSPQDPS